MDYSSKEELYKNLPVAVVVLLNGKHLKITNELYDKIYIENGFFIEKTWVSKKEIKDLVPIDDYSNYLKEHS